MKKRNAVFLGLATMVAAMTAPVATAGDASAFESLNENYEAIRITLLNDNMKGIADNARLIEESATKLQRHYSASHAGVSADNAAACEALLPEISEAAGRLAKASEIEAAREAFGELSKPMVRYREMVSGERPVVVYCPMAKKAWLQPEGEIGNPYYGQSMARCGNVVSK